MAIIGESDYRGAARERLAEAFVLLRAERLSGSIYLAGRAVEAMLRAVIWKSDPDYATGRKSLETGHDLRGMLKLLRNLGVLRSNVARDELLDDVQSVARLWSNNMRFLPTAAVNRIWYNLREIDGKRSLKRAASEYYDSCSAVLKRCEALWQTGRR